MFSKVCVILNQTRLFSNMFHCVNMKGRYTSWRAFKSVSWFRVLSYFCVSQLGEIQIKSAKVYPQDKPDHTAMKDFDRAHSAFPV